jgi:hypothetical protein
MSAESGRVVPDAVWRDLRRDSQILWWVLLASLPGMFLFAWLLDGALRQDFLFPLVTLVFLAAIGVAGLRVARFACPRCGKPFFETWYFFQLLRRECAHCRLPRESGIPPTPAVE